MSKLRKVLGKINMENVLALSDIRLVAPMQGPKNRQ